MRLNNPSTIAASALTALVLIISACGDDRVEGYGGAPEPGITSSATARPTTEATPAATPSIPAAPAAPVTLTLVAESVHFDQTSLVAPAGPVTIAFDNRDRGISHNVHVFAGGDASGASVGSTDIQAGAVQQTLELGSLAAGSYFYQCDVHPSQMMGTLTAS